MFCAVGQYSAVSVDGGVTWVQSANPMGTFTENGVCFNPPKYTSFFFSGSDGSGFHTSSNGLEWSGISPPFAFATARNIVAGNGISVLCGYMAHIYVSGSDGSFTSGSLPSGFVNNPYITFGIGRFCAVSSIDSISATSADGLNWTTGSLTASTSTYDQIATYAFGKFFVFNSGTNEFLTSTDGLTWSNLTLAASYVFKAAVAGAGKLVVIVDNTSVLTTSDGAAWTLTVLPGGLSDWCSIAFDNGIFCAISNSGDLAATSTDGVSWTTYAMPAGIWNSITGGFSNFWHNFVNTHESTS